MAEKELRRMSRTELIEIIYALQQNERALRDENESLRRQLDDKIIRIENAGSIAEAALSLNHIFEDAQAAAQQYLDSVKATATDSSIDASPEPIEVSTDGTDREAGQDNTWQTVREADGGV